MTAKNLVLRTVYIDPEVDDQLRNEAFAGRTSKNDLFRKYLMLGMKLAQQQAAAGKVAGVVKGKAAPAKAKPAAAKTSVKAGSTKAKAAAQAPVTA